VSRAGVADTGCAGWDIGADFDLDGFLDRPLVARLATVSAKVNRGSVRSGTCSIGTASGGSPAPGPSSTAGCSETLLLNSSSTPAISHPARSCRSVQGARPSCTHSMRRGPSGGV